MYISYYITIAYTDWVYLREQCGLFCANSAQRGGKSIGPFVEIMETQVCRTNLGRCAVPALLSSAPPMEGKRDWGLSFFFFLQYPPLQVSTKHHSMHLILEIKNVVGLLVL